MERYELEKPDNLVEMFEESVEKHAEQPFLGTKRGSSYEWVTYRDVARRVNELRAGLASLGVGEGDTVGIIANNCVEWAVACYATYGRGARFVPMYEVELPKIWKYIMTAEQRYSSFPLKRYSRGPRISLMRLIPSSASSLSKGAARAPWPTSRHRGARCPCLRFAHPPTTSQD